MDVVVQVGKAGEGKEIFFVNHDAKAVFRGMSLGADYDCAGLKIAYACLLIIFKK